MVGAWRGKEEVEKREEAKGEERVCWENGEGVDWKKEVKKGSSKGSRLVREKREGGDGWRWRERGRGCSR